MKFLFISNLPTDFRSPRHRIVTSDPVAWIYAMRGDHKHYEDVDIEKLSEHDLVMIWLLPIPAALDKYLQIVKSGKTNVIVYIDLPVGIQCNCLPVYERMKYLEIVRAAKWVFTYKAYREADAYFKVLTGGRELEYVNIPYPVEYIRSVQTPLREKERKVIEMGKGWGERRQDRGATYSWATFAALQKEFPELRALCHPNHAPDDTGDERVPGTYMRDVFGILTEEGVPDPPFLELRMTTWMDYVRELSPCYMGIHLDGLFTRGQFALECAGLRIPCICSGSDAGRQLFPETFVRDPWDIRRAADLGVSLLKDPKFYEEVVNKAEETLIKEFSYEVINRQVREITGVV